MVIADIRERVRKRFDELSMVSPELRGITDGISRNWPRNVALLSATVFLIEGSFSSDAFDLIHQSRLRPVVEKSFGSKNEQPRPYTREADELRVGKRLSVDQYSKEELQCRSYEL